MDWKIVKGSLTELRDKFREFVLEGKDFGIEDHRTYVDGPNSRISVTGGTHFGRARFDELAQHAGLILRHVTMAGNVEHRSVPTDGDTERFLRFVLCHPRTQARTEHKEWPVLTMTTNGASEAAIVALDSLIHCLDRELLVGSAGAIKPTQADPNIIEIDAITQVEAAELAGVSERTIGRAIEDGRLSWFRGGRVDRKEVVELSPTLRQRRPRAKKAADGSGRKKRSKPDISTT